MARRSFAKAFMGYALGRPGASNALGYRGHFTRMGFDEVLLGIEVKRDGGATPDELAEMFPESFLRQMGYYGKASGASAALAELSRGLDTAVVRIVGARPGVAAAEAVMRVCAPA